MDSLIMRLISIRLDTLELTLDLGEGRTDEEQIEDNEDLLRYV
jgi:hypothetical protein